MNAQEFLRLNAYNQAHLHAPKFKGVSKRAAKNKRFSVHRKANIRKIFVMSIEVACPWLTT